MQAQLKDIKQKLAESDAESNQKLEELRVGMRNEMKEEVARMGKEVNEEISNRLRTFFQKANVELKKDILKVASEEFLSFSYGEDL
jgi:DNA anti-recombination protein RmuC